MSDKSNVMRYGHDLWQRVLRARSPRSTPRSKPSHLYVDALTMQMIRKPEQFDVIVTNNMFGDIVTDLGAALQGGLGMAASANLHPGRTSMFEPVHGSAPKYAGTGTANPMAAILTVGLMLDDLGHGEAAAGSRGGGGAGARRRRHDRRPGRLRTHRGGRRLPGREPWPAARRSRSPEPRRRRAGAGEPARASAV